MSTSCSPLRPSGRRSPVTNWLVPVVFASTLLGCGDDATSVPEEEPLVPEAEVEALIEVLEVVDSFFTSDAWASLRETGDNLLAGFLGSPAPIPASIVGTGTTAAAGGSADAPRAIPAVPIGLLGQTWIYSTTAGKYVHDLNRLGAPGDGVRLVMYRQGKKGLDENGWIDVREAAAASPNEWRVDVLGVEGGSTFANYTTQVSGPAGTGLLRPTRIDMDGIVVAGNELLRFEINSWSPDPVNPTLDIDWLFTWVSRGFFVNATVSGVPITGQGVENLNYTFSFQGFDWKVNYNDNRGDIDALISVNGVDLATTTGGIAQPTIVGFGSAQLSQRTRFLLIRLLLVASGIFGMHNELFTPPGAVILGGL